jgi:NADH-quinone oxidoreductase subunit L
MLGLLWLVPTLPLAGYLILTLIGSRLSNRNVAMIGVGSVGVSAIVAGCVGVSFLVSPPTAGVYQQLLWNWIQVGNFKSAIAFHLDALSLVMVLVVTFVGFLIHLYSADFMKEEEGYSRFFSYMNLFVSMMLILLLADNLLFLYLGWEGVGLCSYLLIGFWYQDPENGRAARKAFIVTRVGDTAMAIGLFLLFHHLGSLQIQDLMQRIPQLWPVGSGLAVVAASLILAGAVGKSAQLPLQVWLPDAMAGPTPVSALIHAATMVTAGVYLIARTHVLFIQAPAVLTTVAVIGALTLILAGFSALTQWDIKRVLAYSTMSQIGYMFLALGVGAWSAAIFHFMTHAFFKALLFLGAGVIISRLHHEHNMFKMGGLRKELPWTFWTFLIGAASLSALPLVTAGFYSKDQILSGAWFSNGGSPWLWAAGLFGALLTSIYTFRMVFLTFFGETKPLVKENSPLAHSGYLLRIPLLLLAVLSIVGGWINLPSTLGNLPVFSNFLHSVLPSYSKALGRAGSESTFEIIASLTSLTGIFLAYLFFMRMRKFTHNLSTSKTGSAAHRLWFIGWGFDWIYDVFILQPFQWFAQVNKDDWIDRFFLGVAEFNVLLHRALSWTQSGKIRWYAVGIGFGAVLTIAMAVLL